jgi:hypothetical protein
LTDGFVPTEVAARFYIDRAPLEVFKAMDLAGLVHFDDTRGGYQFHDWHHYQPKADKVHERRKKDRDRKAAQS